MHLNNSSGLSYACNYLYDLILNKYYILPWTFHKLWLKKWSLIELVLFTYEVKSKWIKLCYNSSGRGIRWILRRKRKDDIVSFSGTSIRSIVIFSTIQLVFFFRRLCFSSTSTSILIIVIFSILQSFFWGLLAQPV